MVTNATGEWSLEEVLIWLQEAGESWPIYFDVKNRKYATDPGERLVLIGWYNHTATAIDITEDAQYTLNQHLASKYKESESIPFEKMAKNHKAFSKYPSWVCWDCGHKAAKEQGKTPNTVATYHMGDPCGVCGTTTEAVTEPRDFGYPEFKKKNGPRC